MPYYVYAVKPFAQLEKLAEFTVFTEASKQAKTLRAGPLDAGTSIRVMFADSALAAEDLLLQIRDPRPAGEE